MKCTVFSIHNPGKYIHKAANHLLECHLSIINMVVQFVHVHCISILPTFTPNCTIISLTSRSAMITIIVTLHYCPTSILVSLCVFCSHLHQYTGWCYLRFVTSFDVKNGSCNYTITDADRVHNIVAEMLGYDLWMYIAFIVLPLLYLSMHCYLRCKVMWIGYTRHCWAKSGP